MIKMKLSFVRNLKGSGEETLAKDVMNNQGGILLKEVQSLLDIESINYYFIQYF